MGRTKDKYHGDIHRKKQKEKALRGQGFDGRCRVCGLHKKCVYHHTSYEPEETIAVCHKCHHRIHFEDGFRDDLDPTTKHHPSDRADFVSRYKRAVGNWKDRKYGSEYRKERQDS